MQPKVETIGDVAVVEVPFEQLAMGAEFDFKLAMATILGKHRKLVLDLNRVQFIDSAGCGAIISCLKKLREAGDGELKLCQVNPVVRTVFDLIRLHKICDILETRDEAVRAFGA